MGQMTKVIQQAIRESGQPLVKLAWLAGIDHGQLSRFMREERQLTLPVVEQICDVLQLELCRRGPPKQNPKGTQDMREIIRADDLLDDGEAAIAILTNGDSLDIEGGTTGTWIVNRSRSDQARTVIIFHRPLGTRRADVYRADYVKAVRSPEYPRRHVIHFRNATLTGSSQETWKDFATTGQSPIRYFNM